MQNKLFLKILLKETNKQKEQNKQVSLIPCGFILILLRNQKNSSISNSLYLFIYNKDDELFLVTFWFLDQY